MPNKNKISYLFIQKPQQIHGWFVGWLVGFMLRSVISFRKKMILLQGKKDNYL